MKTKITNSLLLPLLAFFLMACNGYHYDQKRNIENAEWAYKDLKEFDFEITDTNTLYNIFLEVCHAGDYTAQNLYTKVYVTFPDGSERNDQVSSIELADSRGEWLGNCSSKKCIRRVSFMPNVSFTQAGKYKVKLEQYTRQEKILGVESLRLIVEKLKDKKEATHNNKKKIS